jgi:GrpB-like predicted nucleotidyltransferase (UPF0157 family)
VNFRANCCAAVGEGAEVSVKRVAPDGERSSNTDRDAVEICPYDARWPLEFTREKARIESVLPVEANATLEHFGSTAIPGMAAKPIIDILVICSNRALWCGLRRPVEALGYVYWAEDPDPEHMFFARGLPPFGEKRSHHVHVRTPAVAERHLMFRDALRTWPADASAYAELRRALARRFRTDRDAYTEGKSVFVADVLRRWRESAARSRRG